MNRPLQYKNTLINIQINDNIIIIIIIIIIFCSCCWWLLMLDIKKI